MKRLLALLFGLFAAVAAQAAPPEGMPIAAAGEFDFANIEKAEYVSVWQHMGVQPTTERYDEMGGQQYFRGTWFEDRETSFFTFAGLKDCFDAHDHSCIELDGAALDWPGLWQCTQRYELEFVGRRYLSPQTSMGFPAYKVVVDKVISAKRLADPTKGNICGAPDEVSGVGEK